MAYFHGVRMSEIPTSIVPPVQTTAGLPVVFGTAPVHLTAQPTAYVNKPLICYDYQEAVAGLGYSANWKDFSLCEVMYSQFQLYAVSPTVFVNVLDPSVHKKKIKDAKGHAVTDKTVVIRDNVLLSTLTVKLSAEAQPAVLDTDYSAAYNDDAELVISVIDGGALVSAATIFVDYEALDPSLVTASDIIGGVSQATGKSKGLELVNNIYTRFSLVPGILAAPGWSQRPEVAAVMKAKARAINDVFRCLTLTDVDTEVCVKYADVNQWKNANGYTGNNQVVCWPCVSMGDHVYHMSTHIMGILGVMDHDNTDVPYESPSNLPMQATGICLKNGDEVELSLAQANLLNSQGIMTALNFVGGWKAWGNYTGAYPSKTDPKDVFICVRRMFDWEYQTFILTYWQKVDRPLMPRLVKTIIDSEEIRLNGLAARGYLLGRQQVLFLETENPLTDLLNGIFRVHIKLTPPVPAQTIEGILEYDTDNFRALFSATA